MLDLVHAYGATIRFDSPMVFEGRLYAWFYLDPGNGEIDIPLDQVFENKKVPVDTKDIEINGVDDKKYKGGD